MKLFCLFILAGVFIYIVGCFVYTVLFRDKEMSFFKDYKDVLIDIFNDYDYIFFFVLVVMLASSFVINYGAYSREKTLSIQQFQLEELTEYNNQYIFYGEKDGNLIYKVKDMDNISDLNRSDVWNIMPSDNGNYMNVRFYKYSKAKFIPRWLIDKFFIRDDKKDIVAYDFYLTSDN